MSDNRISVVHEVQPGDGLTVCCGRSLFELPMTDRATNDSRQRTCHSADQSPPSSRVDLSRLVGGGDPSSGVVELPEDEVEAVAQAAAGAARAGGGVVHVRDALLPELHLLAARVRAEAAETVAVMCHWVQDVGAVRARESHEAFHFGYSCPYEAAAVMLRGEPDPRRATVSDSGFLARVRAEAVADERQRAVEEIRAAKGEQVRAFGSDPIPYLAGRVDGLEDAARIVAAGSVPVATPESEPTAMGPCGHYWATGPHTYTNTAQWPNVIGHCPGPVAIPTEPLTDEHLDKWAAAVTLPGHYAAQLVDEIRSLRAADASPVPAEASALAPESWGDLAADVMGLVDRTLDGKTPAPTEQPAAWFRETEESLAMLDDVRAEVAAVEAAAEFRAARAELSVLRPALRRVKQRIGRLLAEMDQEEADALEVQAGEYAGTFIEATRVRAALTGTETAGQAVGHLALIQASLPPGLTEVAGGVETHCRAELERWVAEHGLRDGERALIVGIEAETTAEPGVGVYTVPAGPQ